MKKSLLAIIAAALWIAPTTASAMSGADFLHTNKQFAEGYAFGVLESLITYTAPEPEHVAVAQWRAACVTKANLNSSTIYASVAEFIRQDPRRLSEPANGAVWGVLHRMCD